MDDFLIILSAACLVWGLGIALVFRGIPALIAATRSLHSHAQQLALTVAALLLILGGTTHVR